MQRYLFLLLCLLLAGTLSAVQANPQLQLLIEQEKYSAAVRSGEKLLLQDPQNTEVGFLTAYAYQMSGNTDQAILRYEAMIRDHPSQPEPRNNLAMIYMGMGDYDRASQLLVDALNTHSSYATAYANLNRVYKGIASEAYRRAVSQSSEPANYRHPIALTAITSLDLGVTDSLPAVAQAAASSEPTVVAKVEAPSSNTASPVNSANLDTLLIETVRNWAGAWSGKQFDTYTAAYVPGYRAKFSSHAKWVKHRRGRILRPGEIKVLVSDFSVKQRGENRASVRFVQAFSSPGYSDRVVKRLEFSRVGGQWKIITEKVLSVL